METRLEKNKRARKKKRIRKIKGLCILILLCIMIVGIDIVNQNIIELNCLENPNILRFDLDSKEVDVFGETYIMDLNFLDKIKNFNFNIWK